MTRNELTAQIKIAQDAVAATISRNAPMSEYHRAMDEVKRLMWIVASDDPVIVHGPATTHRENFYFDEDQNGNAA